MVAITKNEKESIARRFPGICIVRTAHGKSNRHRYYCEESPKAMQYLKNIRENSKITEVSPANFK